MTDEDWVTVVNPWDVGRLQLGARTSHADERLVVCNGFGDYEVGRFAVMDWER